MRALSLTQPWATLVVLGLKKIETRSWSTKFRGRFAIHASKGFPRSAKDLVISRHFAEAFAGTEYHLRPSRFPLGAIIGSAELAMCLPTNGAYFRLETTDVSMLDGVLTSSHTQKVDYRRPDENTSEFHFGDYSEGRFMYFLENVVKFAEPVPCRGALSFWEIPMDVSARLV